MLGDMELGSEVEPVLDSGFESLKSAGDAVEGHSRIVGEGGGALSPGTGGEGGRDQPLDFTPTFEAVLSASVRCSRRTGSVCWAKERRPESVPFWDCFSNSDTSFL